MSQPGRSLRRSESVLSLYWGFAEATWFFVVPDVLLSRIALRSARVGYLAVAIATVGALIGGAIVHRAGAHDFPSASAKIDRVPWITPAMIDQADRSTREEGLRALARAPLAGQPYKMYAASAGRHQISLVLFFVVSMISRAARFALSVTIAVGARRLLEARIGARGLVVAHAGTWLAFYAWYWHSISS